MTLRSRLFLLFGGLVAVLLGAQWWMLRSLAYDLDVEVEALTVSVGESIVRALQEESPKGDGITARAIQVQLTHKENLCGDESEVADCVVSEAFSFREETAPKGGGAPPRVIRFIRHLDGSEHSEDELLELAEKDLSRLGGNHTVPLKILRDFDRSISSLIVATGEDIEQIPIPMNNLEARVRRFTNRMLAGTGALLLVGLVMAGLFAHGMTRPLRQLASAARQLGDGDLGVRVETSASGEVGETIQAFNSMSARLQQLEEDTRRLRAGQHLSELGEVSRGLAHSLRNPLNALGLSLDRLGDDDLGPTDRQRLATAARQHIRRVDSSLRSFLALASSGSVAEEDVDVAALIQDVALEALQSSDAGPHDGETSPSPQLETEIEEGLPKLRAVQPELRAVLQALVVNAIEASPAGGRIRLEATAGAGGFLRIEVQDDGPGLAPEVRERLFSPHVTTKEQGSGMGLYLAQRIATNRYGGKLRLEEATPSGSGPSGTRAVLEIGPRIPRWGTET